MKTNDKVLAAFLVSVGLFPVVQATQYVASLSTSEKKAMMPIVNLSASEVSVSVDIPIPQAAQNNLK